MNRFQVFLGKISMAVCIIMLGLVVCVVPASPTQLFSGWYADEDNSPMTREELVSFAATVHDYTFFDQNRTLLYADIVKINEHIAEDGRASDGQPVITAGDEASVAAAFDAADEAYVLHTDMVNHLDDVSKAVMIVFVVGLVFLVVAAAEIMNGLFRGHRSDVARILIRGGQIAIVVLVLALAWGLFAFDSLFTTMHQLLFAEGTWTFSEGSALICALPTEFWMAMGVLWLGVSAIVALVSIFIGVQLKKYKI